MRVRELIDILREHDPDAEVELAIVDPVDDDSDDITVDLYPVDVVRPNYDNEADGGPSVWLVGGEDDDVDAFIDAIEDEPED